jgi:hypothetical protein
MPAHFQSILQNKYGNSGLEANAMIYFSHICSCVVENSNQYDPNCPLCNYGYVYEDAPVPNLITRTGMKIDRTVNESMYLFYDGGMRATIYKPNNENTRPYYELTQWDVIVIPTDTIRNHSGCLIGKKDVLLDYSVQRIISVKSREKVEGGYTEITYTEGEDYTAKLSEKISSIEWLNGKRPSKSYTVEYISGANYMIWESAPKVRGGSDSEDPRVVYCIKRPYFDPRQSPYLGIKTAPGGLLESV